MTEDKDSATSSDEMETISVVSQTDKVNNNTTSMKILRGLECGPNSTSLNFSISRLLSRTGVSSTPGHSSRRRRHRHEIKSEDEGESPEGKLDLPNYSQIERQKIENLNGSEKGGLSNGSSGHQSDSDIDVHAHNSTDNSDVDDVEEEEEEGKGKMEYQESETVRKTRERDNHPLYPSHHQGESHPNFDGQNPNQGNQMNPFPVFGYSSIFLPNFPCPLTSPSNHVIRVPAHRPMSNFQMFTQSGHPSMNEINASPLFSNFDPRSSLLLKDRLSGKSCFSF